MERNNDYNTENIFHVDDLGNAFCSISPLN